MSRGSILRSFVAFAIGLVVLGGILFVATTVDGRPPEVERFGLTHHLSSDDEVALTTTSIQVVFSEGVDHASAEAARCRIDSGTRSAAAPALNRT